MQGLSEYQGQLIFVLEPGEKVSSDEENEKLYLRPNFSFDPSLGILSLYWLIQIWSYCSLLSSTVIREISLKSRTRYYRVLKLVCPFSREQFWKLFKEKKSGGGKRDRLLLSQGLMM